MDQKTRIAVAGGCALLLAAIALAFALKDNHCQTAVRTSGWDTDQKPEVRSIAGWVQAIRDRIGLSETEEMYIEECVSPENRGNSY